MVSGAFKSHARDNPFSKSQRFPVAPQWPPKSPHAALLSSPSGRKRAQDYQDRTSPSPSPRKGTTRQPILAQLERPLRYGAEPEKEHSEDEDEETLRLQLEVIEARLKLKRLWKRKRSAGAVLKNEGRNISSQFSPLRNGDQDGSSKGNVPPSSTYFEVTSDNVQVPVSPRRSKGNEAQQKSPGRVLLGIDKGLKAKNISLRNPHSARGSHKANDDPFASVCKAFPHEASTSRSTLDGRGSNLGSFSEKIANLRRDDKTRKDKANRLTKERTTGFGLSEKDLENYQTQARTHDSRSLSTSRTGDQNHRDGFSREQIMRATSRTTEGYSQQSQERIDSDRRPASTAQARSHLFNEAYRRSGPLQSDTAEPRNEKSKVQRGEVVRSKPEEKPDASLFEPYSSLHLTKRLIPYPALERIFGEKAILPIPSLLAEVKSPEYSMPDSLEANFVVLGIIASRSSPFAHKVHKPDKSTRNNDPDQVPKTSGQEAEASRENEHGKYQVFTVTDLRWSLDLYLFDTAFTRFRKLTPGTLIAVLNPSIMPPRPGKSATGRFSLTLNSGEDTILEIGTSRDLGWCKSIKKDGKRCSAWIDSRHTSVCEYHIDRILEKTRAGRMEVNTIATTYGPKGKGGGRTGFWGVNGNSEKSKRNRGTIDGLQLGPQHDRETQSTFFIAPARPGQTAAKLLDGETSMERGGTAANRRERERKRLAQQEQEREIARKLGEGGNGAGGEYLRISSAQNSEKERRGGQTEDSDQEGVPSTGQERTQEQQRMDVLEEARKGLMGNRAGNVQLSPLKKRKLEWMKERDRERKMKKAAEMDSEEGRKEPEEDDDDDELELV